MDTSDYGLTQPVKGPGAITDSWHASNMHWWSDFSFSI